MRTAVKLAIMGATFVVLLHVILTVIKGVCECLPQ